ncbi:unnamed protein product, partial [Linum tenue]
PTFHFPLSLYALSLYLVLSTLSTNRHLTCSSELNPGGNPGSFTGSLPSDEIGRTDDESTHTNKYHCSSRS